MCKCICVYFCVPDLSFSLFSLCFSQKDLPLPRKNSRWVLPLFIPPFFVAILPSLLPPVLSLLSGGNIFLSLKTNNHAELLCIWSFISKVSEFSLHSQALLDRKDEIYIMFESCEDASAGIGCLNPLGERMECQADYGQLRAVDAVHGSGSYSAFFSCSVLISTTLFPLLGY